jgi:hypothetical protein
VRFFQTVRSACRLLIGLLLISGGGISLAQNTCHLKSPKGAIQHVIYVQFDNTHFRRDNPNVPSDLEQMPHLLNFIMGNGVLMSNDHTVLISHTATGPMARPEPASRSPIGRRRSLTRLAWAFLTRA